MHNIYRVNKEVYSICVVHVDSEQTISCIKSISFLNKQRKNVNFQIHTILQMYFPLAHLLYDKFIVKLPDLAQINTMETIQIMHAYGSAPFFHTCNHPFYDY